MKEKMLNNRYHLQKKLGAGGMGTVYLAIDDKFGNYVAVKEAMFLGSDDLREAFFREAKLLNQMRHKSLAHVIDWFEEDLNQFIVMQYIEGKSFDELLREQSRKGQNGFDIATALNWLNQLFEVLEYMHNFRPAVVHQDIKPQNLILTPQNDVILLDFGLVRIKDISNSDYVSMVGGTPRYASPEQMMGGEVDTRTDIFLLAMTFYEILIGIPPLPAGHRVMEIMRSKIDPLKKLAEIIPNIPVNLSEIIHSALAIEKTDRPKTIRDMRNTLNII